MVLAKPEFVAEQIHFEMHKLADFRQAFALERQIILLG